MVDRPGLYGAELCALLWEVPGCDNSHECTAAQRGAAVEAPAPVPLDEELSENSDGSASALSPDEAIRASLRHGMRGAGVRGLGMAPIAHGKNRDEMLAEAARKLGRSQSPPMAASSWNSGGLLMLLPHGSALLLSHTREDGKNFWSGTPSLTQSLAMYEAGGTLR